MGYVMGKLWKKGRGKLGVLEPLVGEWEAAGKSAQGAVRCRRKFEWVLGGKFLQLRARWELGASGKKFAYEEVAMMGVDGKGAVRCWSFVADGDRSEGVLADVTDLHGEAVGFEAKMPAGRARMTYWPGEEGAVRFVVEAKAKTGWRRFLEQTYRRVEGGGHG